MSVIEKLNATDLKLSKSDLRLLDYIRENGLNACSAPISEIARSCDVSHATVTRFARKFGYSSLRSFKIDLARELGVSFATINRWENGSYNPSRLAKKAFEDFCEKRTINISEENN